MNAIREALVTALLLNGVCGRAELKWTPVTGMGHEIFPSFVLATATMEKEPPFASRYAGQENAMHNILIFGDWRHMAGVRILTSDSETKVRVEISGTKFIRPSKMDVTVKGPGRPYWVYPRLEFDYEALRAVREPIPETVTFKVYNLSDLKDGRPVAQSTTETVEIGSLFDCPISRAVGSGPTARHDNWQWMFAAYVNENSPIIEPILQEAQQSRVIDAFAGYQRGEKDVLRQVFAIWNVLQRRGMKYSNITTPSGESDRVFSQTIRPVDESIHYQQANCVDGSVLFASIFRKIGLHSVLVTVPHHCFVGVDLDGPPHPPKWIYIETTMLGSVDMRAPIRGAPRALDLSTLEALRQPASYRSFVAAVNRAHENANLYRETMQIWDVDLLRKQGLRPE
jgi:hypothetical protein